MKLLQITDFHIPDTDEDAYGIDVKSNLLTTLEYIQQQEFDALIITGDIAYKLPNFRSYEYVKQALQNIWNPIFMIAGNHDSFDLLYKFFPQSFPTSQRYYSYTIADTKIIFLDSSRSYIDNEQLQWLKNQLQHGKQAYIFIHHPVLHTDIVYMESKYALQNRDDIRVILEKHTMPVYLFCGHFHAESTIVEKNITQYITPSVFYQINSVSQKFAIGSYDFGYREIVINTHEMSTNVVWVK